MASASFTSAAKADATTIYNYHKMHTPPAPSDAIFCLCSLDTRVARAAAALYLRGIAPLLVFSGGVGKLTQGRFAGSEADAFASIAREMGVPDSAIVVEREASNTGENVRFTHALLARLGLAPRSFVLVQKPYMERRTYATFQKQWPDKGVTFTVTSPDLTFDEYPDAENPVELVLNVMVGDLVRIRDYPARGFQVEQDIPSHVWDAAVRLMRSGYDKHLPEGFKP